MSYNRVFLEMYMLGKSYKTFKDQRQKKYDTIAKFIRLRKFELLELIFRNDCLGIWECQIRTLMSNGGNTLKLILKKYILSTFTLQAKNINYPKIPNNCDAC